MKDRIETELAEFAKSLEAEGVSPATVLAYTKSLRPFLDFALTLGLDDPAQVTNARMDQYLAHVQDWKRQGNYSDNSVGLRVRAVKRWFRHLQAIGRVKTDLAAGLPEPKKVQPDWTADILSEDELQEILAQPKTTWLTGIRDRALLEVLACSGMRLKEICSLEVGDCDLEHGVIEVRPGKGVAGRVNALSEEAISHLKEYLALVRPCLMRVKFESRSLPKETKRLWLTKQGTYLDDRDVRVMLEAYAKQAGIKKRVTPHIVRLSVAAKLLRQGKDATFLRESLGYSAIALVWKLLARLGLHTPRQRKKKEG